MAQYDWSAVSAAITPNPATAGGTLTLAVGGQVKRTDDPQTVVEVMTASLQLRASDGATQTMAAQPVSITKTVPGQVTFLNATIVSVTDTGGRVWTVGAGGVTATATA